MSVENPSPPQVAHVMDPKPRHQPEHLAAGLKLAFAMAGWGTIAIFSLQAGTDPLSTAAWRCVFAVAVLLPLSLATRSFRLSAWSLRAVLLTFGGGLALVANWVLLFTSFRSTTITVATVSYHMEPFFLIGFGALITREIPRRRDLLWLLVAFVGLLFAVQFVGLSGLAAVSPDEFSGVAWALAAGALYALATLAAKHTHGIKPYVMTLLQCGLGAAVLLPFSAPLRWDQPGWLWIAAMGVVHTGLLYTALYSAAPLLSTARLAAFSFINPAVAIITDIALYHHVPDVFQILGIAVLALATIAVTKPRKEF